VFSMEMGAKVVSAPVCQDSSLCQVLSITGRDSRKCFLWKWVSKLLARLSSLSQVLTITGRDRPLIVFSMEMVVKVVSAPACYGSSLGQVLTITGRDRPYIMFSMEVGVKLLARQLATAVLWVRS
jgi:hypothetical protein